MGDSLTEAINRGIAGAAFGVVIFSQNFFKKNWPKRELDGLFAGEIANRNRILPVWHEVTLDDVLRRWPILADKLSANSSLGTRGLADVIERAMRADD